MTGEEYKKLSLKEFDRAAVKFDDEDPSVYNLCRKGYPDVLAEAVSEPFLICWMPDAAQGQCSVCLKGTIRIDIIPEWICRRK